MGIAAGLSSEGTKVITTTFAPFQTMRCLEQIKVNLGYMRHKVCMVGLASGLVLGTLGYTHCSIEDVSIIRSIPNLTVVTPADCLETAKTVVILTKSLSAPWLPNAEAKEEFPAKADPIPPVLLDCNKTMPIKSKATITNIKITT